MKIEVYNWFPLNLIWFLEIEKRDAIRFIMISLNFNWNLSNAIYRTTEMRNKQMEFWMFNVHNSSSVDLSRRTYTTNKLWMATSAQTIHLYIPSTMACCECEWLINRYAGIRSILAFRDMLIDLNVKSVLQNVNHIRFRSSECDVFQNEAYDVGKKASFLFIELSRCFNLLVSDGKPKKKKNENSSSAIDGMGYGVYLYMTNSK